MYQTILILPFFQPFAVPATDLVAAIAGRIHAAHTGRGVQYRGREFC